MKKHAITVGLVATGVLVAGFAMSQLSDIDFVAKAQNGFQGVI